MMTIVIMIKIVIMVVVVKAGMPFHTSEYKVYLFNQPRDFSD